ncbi:RNA polymerase II transcriptional coactivator KELP-like [Rhodamnia argentea]|uniref:RNA polymerase II transcriptional coactivator KELP-like n=1 Tax=Rhodamnia argentea TaxID=178133 RepID=A0A8B8P662_9MYRT|nr:RNA polymerase II transcriptional coactivator KELP-like [Rhodamnia argentea]
MSAGMQQLIAKTAREVLQESDADEVTEHQLRMEVSKRLGVDLALPKHKAIVSLAMQSFLEGGRVPEDVGGDAHEDREAGEDPERSDAPKEYTDGGDLVICKLSEQRKVTVGKFKGKPLVSMRKYYNKDGKERPSPNGISLTADQWLALKNSVPAIEAAIKKMTSGS